MGTRKGRSRAGGPRSRGCYSTPLVWRPLVWRSCDEFENAFYRHFLALVGILDAMQAASLALAAALSIAAIVIAFTSVPRWIAVVLLVVAAVALFVGLREKYRAMEDEPIELDAEQEETVRRLKAEGREDLAVRQVQLWFRNADHGTAADVVRDIV